MKTTAEFYRDDEFTLKAKVNSHATSHWATLEVCGVNRQRIFELTFFRNEEGDARRVIFDLINALLSCLERDCGGNE